MRKKISNSEPSRQLGRHEEAQAAIRRARELDPLVAVEHALSAQVAFVGKDYAAALQFARQSIVVDPEFWIGLFQFGQAYVQLGESELALDALNNAGRFSGGNSKVLSLRGYLFAKLGRPNEALQVLNTLEAIAMFRRMQWRRFTLGSVTGTLPWSG